MKYKHKWYQILNKRLNVPRRIESQIFSNRLSLSDYIKYELYGKIPLECLKEKDRNVLNKFGLEKILNLDWEIISMPFDHRTRIDFLDILDKIPDTEENLNDVIYDIVKEIVPPSYYSTKMKELFQDRYCKIPDKYNESKEEHLRKEAMKRYNEGDISLDKLIINWDIFENMRFSYHLNNDDKNTYGLTEQDVREFVNNHKSLVSLIAKYEDIYKFIYEYSIIEKDNQKKEFMKRFTDSILEKTNDKNEYKRIQLSNEEYKAIFKYSSLEEELRKYDEYYSSLLIRELHDLSPDYIFNTKIPFELFKDRRVTSFVAIYGLQNIVEFDEECNNFFTKNDFRMLKAMFETYMHYSHNANDEYKFYIVDGKKENGVLTKDTFYEIIRRMLLNGPTNYDYMDYAPNYEDLTGEFRKRFPELYIDENVPEEFKKAFYTKQLTPNLIKKYPEYIEELRGKRLKACFKSDSARQKDERNWTKYVSLFQALEENLTFEEFMEIIQDYSEILAIYMDYKNYERGSKLELVFEKDLTLDTAKHSMNDLFKRMLIHRNIEYPKNLPEHLRENMKGLFLPNDAPEELKDMLYTRKLDRNIFTSHPEYKKYFNNFDIEILCKPLIVWSHQKDGRNKQINLLNEIKNKFGPEAIDIILYYGDYLEKMSIDNEIILFTHNDDASKEEILDEIDKRIFDFLLTGTTKYNTFMNDSFKKKYPYMFLDENVDKEIQDKFYNREFTIEDFENSQDLLNIFGETNIICGLSLDYAWLIPVFSNYENKIEANIDRIKIVNTFNKIKDKVLEDAFKEYISESIDDLDVEKLDYVAEVFHRLSISNSQEVVTFKKELATQILKSENPLESLIKIEDLFIKNNIPTVGKIYSCFEILHPNFKGFEFTENSRMSPVLIESTNHARKAIVFSDLIKASFGSNNRSVNNYLRNLEFANNLYEEIMSKKVNYDTLDEQSKFELDTFLNHLITMYSKTNLAKKDINGFTKTDDVIKDITEMKKLLSPFGNMDYNLADRVINMFCHFAGIETLEEAKQYIKDKIESAEKRNIEASKKDMVLEEGDFVKGVPGAIQYLGNILQNGSVSKEYLGASATSDFTPLDTDVSRIMTKDGTNLDKLAPTIANRFGELWFVLKGDDRFQMTRGASNEAPLRMKNKLEVFETGGPGHYGIRTGFASTDIDYIMVEKYDERVAIEIVKNGFYIPIASKEGKIIFSYEDYQKLQSKMNGLSYYNQTKYTFSNNLVTPRTEELASQIEQSNYETNIKRTKINNLLMEALKEINLKLKTSIDGDLTEGSVELLDTGSTGRGTNKPGDGDFDFIMRVDRRFMADQNELNKLKSILLKKLNKSQTGEIIASGDFRLKDVKIDPSTIVDIDITFIEKTDQLQYSTDMCLKDRLTTIYKQDPEKYKYVIANILLAKEVLKKGNVYKPYRSDPKQGGLGGVGIENWILQNGGSFIDAARSFVEASNGKTWEEFSEIYKVWDFGANHLAAKRGSFPHDNFVYNNMSREGYEKMTTVLKEYIKQYEQEQTKGRRR